MVDSSTDADTVECAELVNALKLLQLEDLAKDWVDSIWDKNFADVEVEFENYSPTIYESEDFSAILQRVLMGATAYEAGANDAEFWVRLEEEGVCRRALVTLLFGAVRSAADLAHRRVAATAAALYFALCSLNGAPAYQLYHAIVYQKCVDVATTTGRLLGASAGGDQSSMGGGGGGRKAKGVQPTAPAVDADAEGAEAAALDDDERDELGGLLADMLKRLWLFLAQSSLRHCPNSVDYTVAELRQLVWLDGSKARRVGMAEGDVDMDRRNHCEKALACFHRLVAAKHDEHAKVVLARFVMPRLLMVTPNNRAFGAAVATAPTWLNQPRQLALDFTAELIRTSRHLATADHDPIMPTVFLLAQNVCENAPTKADFRAKVGLAVAALVRHFPLLWQKRFVRWLQGHAEQDETGWRLFATDVAVTLLDSAISEHSRARLQSIVLLRCVDSAPTVRARAFACLAQLLTTDSDEQVQHVVAATSRLHLPAPADDDDDGDDMHFDPPEPLDYEENLVWLVGRHCKDEKVWVRKAAVQCAEGLVRRCWADPSTTGLLKEMRLRCTDLLLSVRKQAAECLSRLILERPDSVPLRVAWLQGVLPLSVDRETSAVDLSAKLFQQVVLTNLSSSDGALAELGWSLVATVEKRLDSRRQMHRVMSVLVANKQIESKLVRCLENDCKDPARAEAAWLLLSSLCHAVKVNPTAARVAWMVQADLSKRCIGYMAKILASSCDRLSDGDAADLLADIGDKLSSHRIPPENTALVFYALVCLHKRLAPTAKQADANLQEWCGKLIAEVEEALSAAAFVNGGVEEGEEGGGGGAVQQPPPSDEGLVRRLFVLGEAAQLCPRVVSRRIVLACESLIAADTLAPSASRLPPPERSASAPVGGRRAVAAPVRRHAVTALGKLCLVDEERAKQSVGLLVREARSSADYVVRNNVIIALTDLCVRYTSLVDRHLGTLTAGLRDPATLVRRQTLTLITNLLKENFLRWKGVIPHRFLMTLLDAEESIRSFAEYCLVNVLQVQQPQMFFHNFVEAFYFFNGVRHPTRADDSSVTAHAAAAEPDDADDAPVEFSLTGAAAWPKRRTLYLFMARQFNDNDKFLASAKLAADVLGVIAEETLPLTNRSCDLLADALRVLAAPDMKLGALPAAAAAAVAGGAADDDNELHEPAPAVVQEIAKKAFATLVKRAIMEHIIPNVLSLRLLLLRKRHPLQKLLLAYIVEIMKDFPDDVEEVLAADHQLAKEIKYDLEKLKHDKQDLEARQERERLRLEQDKREQEEAVAREAARVATEQLDEASECMSPDARAQTPVAAANQSATRNVLTPNQSANMPPPPTPQSGRRLTREEVQAVLERSLASASRASRRPARRSLLDDDDDDDDDEEAADTVDELAVEQPRHTRLRSSRLAARAVSTPDASSMPDVTFRLGHDFTVANASSSPTTHLRRVSARTAPKKKARVLGESSSNEPADLS